MRKKSCIIKIDFLLGSILVSILLLSGCTQQQNNPGINTVSIDNLAFNPNTLSIANGTQVTWINNDSTDHTIIDEGGLFNSGTIIPGKNFTYTFTTAGSYNYYCSLHPSMRGTILVQ